MNECWVCRTTNNLQRHHIYEGKNRQTSERIGAVVYLCLEHHTGNTGVHHRADLRLRLERWWQEEYEKEHSRDEFMRLIGRNYL